MAEASQNQTKYQQCCDSILQYIKDNHLTEGDRLPTEPQLIEMLGASRITVRRAISELEAGGVVKKVQGSGTFVAAPPVPQAAQTAIPLIIPGNSTDNALLTLIQGAGDYLAQFGAHPTTYFAHSGEEEQKIITQLVADGEKCIMLYPFSGQVNQLFFPRMERQGIEFIYMGRRPVYTSGSFVGPDDISGGYQAARHLLDQGYSQIAFISATPEGEARSITMRIRGMRQALEESGFPVDSRYIRCVEEGETFADVLEQLMSLTPAPDAFFCSNDITAVELMYRLGQYQVPGQSKIAVIGFDNSSILKSLPFSLSTIEQSFYRTGYEAARSAMKILTNKPDFAVCKILPVMLIPRDSTPKKG